MRLLPRLKEGAMCKDPSGKLRVQQDLLVRGGMDQKRGIGKFTGQPLDHGRLATASGTQAAYHHDRKTHWGRDSSELAMERGKVPINSSSAHFPLRLASHRCNNLDSKESVPMAIIDEQGVRRRLKIMLGSEPLADVYIKRFGYTIHIAKINGLKIAMEYRAMQQNGGVAEEPKPKVAETDWNDPIFEIQVKCPACFSPVPYWDQKARALGSSLDMFHMPSYKPVGTFRAADYNLIAVSVCPQCFFASPDKKDFIVHDSARYREVPSRLQQGELAALLTSADDRTTMLEESGIDITREHVFGRERTPQGAIFAYDLSIHRALIESRRSIPFALFKMAGYSLKQALIARTYKLDETPYLEHALEHYLKCFETSNAPGQQYEANVLYEIIALNVRLGKITDAGAFVAVLEKVKAEASLPDIPFIRWYNAARDLWSDRDNPDLWK
jgi:hypothetical protein